MTRTLVGFLAVILSTGAASAQQDTSGRGTVPASVFSFSEQLVLPGSPEAIFDAITGDITPWWDHTFSEKPFKLYIEPRPGGGFYEIFNAGGEGVLHATVTFAVRGKMLRYVGPLGLAGKAIDMVTTQEFTAVGKDSTRLVLSVHAAGELDPGLPAIIQKVWHHFLFERFKPYIETGAYTNRIPLPPSK